MFWRDWLDFLMPKTCVHCGRDLEPSEEEPLCGDCFGRLRQIVFPYCRRCGVFLESGGAHCFSCRGGSFKCEKIRAAFSYGSEIQSLVEAFKYRGRDYLARPLARWMAEAFLGYEEILEAEIFVPVPLHPKRLKERGFNQSLLLAQEISRRLKRPLSEAVKRVAHTKAQWNLGRKERLENIQNAFESDSATEVKGRVLCLVDDVCTTGGTLEECAKALKKAGAGKIYAFVLARQSLK